MSKPQYILVHPSTRALVYPGIKSTLNPYGFMAKIFDITPGKPTTPAAALFHMLSAQNELPRAMIHAQGSDFQASGMLFSSEDRPVRVYDESVLFAVLPESLVEKLHKSIRARLGSIGQNDFSIPFRQEVGIEKSSCNVLDIPKSLVPTRQFPYTVFSDLGIEAATSAFLHNKGLVTIESPLRNFHMLDPTTGTQVHTVCSRNPFALFAVQQQPSQKVFKPIIKVTMDKDPSITPPVVVDKVAGPKTNRAKKDIPSDEWILRIHRWGGSVEAGTKRPDVYLIGTWSIENLFYPIVLSNILKHLGSPDKPKTAYGPNENQEYRLVRRQDVPPEGPDAIILDRHKAMALYNPDKKDRIAYSKKWDRVLGTARPSFTPVENDINEVYR